MKCFRVKNKILIFLIFSMLLSCVSVNLNETKEQKSTVVSYAAPEKPFHPVAAPHLDQSWQNNTNGSTISFLSDCNNPVDPSLNNILKGIITEIENTQTIESNVTTYNAREALHSILDGRVDGVLTRFELLIFKKNNCTYIITYAAAAKVFAQNQKDYIHFVRGFKVP